jgi:hypothetical protein
MSRSGPFLCPDLLPNVSFSKEKFEDNKGNIGRHGNSM